MNTLQQTTNAPEIPDYKLAQAEAEAFVSTLGLSFVLTGYSQPTPWRHYAYNLRAEDGQVVHNFPCFQGPGITAAPKPFYILCAVASDAVSAEQASFANFCSDFGYDTDSREAEAIYRECQALGRKLADLGLTKDQIETLAGFNHRF